MDFAAILTAIVGLVAPALAGYLVLQWLKSVVPWLDARKPILKQAIFGLYAVGAALLMPVLGFQLPDLSQFGDPVAIAAAITSLLGFVIHKLFAPKPA